MAGKPVLILTRFDRIGARRIPFLSAMSMLGAKDTETRSYLEIVDALRQHGAAPQEDMQALWRRIVFNVLISNTDDHLRNHAFLYEGQNGWRLSPAYDLTPVPTDIKPHILTTAIAEDDTTASLDLAFKAVGYFEITDERARTIVKEVAGSAWHPPSSTRTWSARAASERSKRSAQRCRIRRPAVVTTTNSGASARRDSYCGTPLTRRLV